jgi:Zn-dependent protease with chaperone function
MADSISLDFGSYVTERKSGFVGEYAGDRYAFSGDLELQRTMRNFGPIQLAISSAVRLSKGMLAGDLLGKSVKVGPKQFPKIHQMVRHCAHTLGIPEPMVFIQGRVDHMNAMTTGTEKESVIIIHASTIDNMSEEELTFVIGHECGHIQNNHVVYLTTLNLLTRIAAVAGGGLLAPLLMPLQLALSSWSRAAEITCDRAGLLCCRDPKVATDSFLKLAIGSRKLFEELNVEAYLQQLKEGREGLGRVGEMTASHPFLTKRVEAVRIFAESALYRGAGGDPGGIGRDELEQRTTELVKVL